MAVASAHPCQPWNGGPCSVSGIKFNDLNANGVKDVGEPGLGGWTLYADYDEDGRLDGPGNDGVDGGGTTEPFAISSSNAEALGQYKISNINCPSSVCGNSQKTDIREVSQANWTCSFPVDCFYDEVDFSCSTKIKGKDFGNWTNAEAPVVTNAGPPTVGPTPLVPTGAPVPGTPRISGPRGCTGKRFRTTVSGQGVTKVVFYLDGNELKTLTQPNSDGKFSVVIDTRKLGKGTHKLKATASFGTTKSTTIKRTFHLCKATRHKSKFTG